MLKQNYHATSPVSASASASGSGSAGSAAQMVRLNESTTKNIKTNADQQAASTSNSTKQFGSLAGNKRRIIEISNDTSAVPETGVSQAAITVNGAVAPLPKLTENGSQGSANTENTSCNITGVNFLCRAD